MVPIRLIPDLVAGGSGIVGARFVGKVVAVEAGLSAEVGELDFVEAFNVPPATHLLANHLYKCMNMGITFS